MKVSAFASTVGKGLVAGFAGTAAMTVSSTLEQHLRGRAASTAPADATAKVLGIAEFSTPAAKNRFSNLVHWGYGTGWGVARGLLGAAGLPTPVAAPVHLASMWGGAAVMLPALGVAPPVTTWGREEVGIDLFHHLVYAGATGLSYGLLTRARIGSAPVHDSLL